MKLPKEQLTRKEQRAVRMAIQATLRIKPVMPGWYYTALLQGIQSMVYCLKSATYLERQDARFRKIDRLLAAAANPRPIRQNVRWRIK
jgi:hypothetical protein